MPIKDQSAILEKLGIEQLNQMQLKSEQAIRAGSEVLILSPTGTGKTLAYFLPLIEMIDSTLHEVQLLIVLPSRELSIQVEQVFREMGSGLKCNAVYGGQSFNQDRINIEHPPAVLVGTPGRLADHIRRNTINTNYVKYLVLDEFDKSLEIGFEQEMKSILHSLPALDKRILTSATHGVEVPAFVKFSKPRIVDYSSDEIDRLKTLLVVSDDRNKLGTLIKLIRSKQDEPGIVFCNLKDSIEHVSNSLNQANIAHGCFFGGLEQKDRERALIKFRNGTHRLIIATDLAARGLDIPEITYIVHYQLPMKEHEFTHRNGRTARMKKDGTAYILAHPKDRLPDYIGALEKFIPEPETSEVNQQWDTIFISGGRRDKISKGDIAGFFIKQGGLTKEQLGLIELKQDCAFIAVDSSQSEELVSKLDGLKLKARKLKVYQV